MANKELDFTNQYVPTNSRKEETKTENKMAPIDIKASVSVKKKGAIGRLLTDLRHRDYNALKENALDEIIIPGLLDLAADGLHYLVDRFIYKDDIRTSYRRRTSAFSSDGSTSYGYWKSSQASKSVSNPKALSDSISYAELGFRGPEGKAAVNNIIDAMLRYSHEYQESGVTIPKLYEFIEESLRLSGNQDYKEVMASLKKLEWTDSKYGWDEEAIKMARPMRVRGGEWVLDLPTPKYLD